MEAVAIHRRQRLGTMLPMDRDAALAMTNVTAGGLAGWLYYTKYRFLLYSNPDPGQDHCVVTDLTII